MQPWKISLGMTAIIMALALMLAGESFVLPPTSSSNHRHRLLDARCVAWRTLAVITLMVLIYAAARALGLADMGLKVDLMERSIRRGGSGQTELAEKLGQEDRGEFPGG